MSIFDSILKPGIHYVQYLHDDDCPTIHTQNMADCVCHKLEMRLSDEEQVNADINRNRAARRKAEREAAKAIKRARGGA